MRILLTGAGGCVGKSTLAELVRRGHRVTCYELDNKSNRDLATQYGEQVDFFWGDLRRGNALVDIIKAQDAIIHLAAVLPPNTERHPKMAQEVNVEGTRRIIEAAQLSRIKPLLIFASSMAVYGPKQYAGVVPADAPVIGTDNYSRHKIAGEKMVRQSTVPWVIVRLAAVLEISDYRKGTFANLKKLFDVAPTNKMEYISPRDVSMALVNTLVVPDARMKILNIGGGEGCQITQREMNQCICSAFGIKIKPSEIGQLDFYTHWLDTSESEQLLHYQQDKFSDFANSMKRMLWPLRWFAWPLRPLIKFAILRVSAIEGEMESSSS